MISNLDGIANIADGQQNEVASVLHPTKMQESSKVHAGVAFACTFVVHYTCKAYIHHSLTKQVATSTTPARWLKGDQAIRLLALG